MDVDDAFNRWGRELKRVEDELGQFSTFVAYLLKVMTWATSEILHFIVAAVAFLATLVGITVGLKKLQE